MNTDPVSYEWRRQLMWGLVLIGFGVAVLLDRLDIFEVDAIWRYWPLLLVVIGINKMIGYPTAKHFTSGLWMMLSGVWLFAVFEGMFGLTLRNSWPVVIIITGLTMFLEPFMRARLESTTEASDEK